MSGAPGKKPAKKVDARTSKPAKKPVKKATPKKYVVASAAVAITTEEVEHGELEDALRDCAEEMGLPLKKALNEGLIKIFTEEQVLTISESQLQLP